MRYWKGFSLIEVLVALAVTVAVGGAIGTLLVRSQQTGRSSEAAEASTQLLRSLVGAIRISPAAWLPTQPGEERTLSPGDISKLLGERKDSFADPSLYTVRVRDATQQGASRKTFQVEVCVRAGAETLCQTQDISMPPVDVVYATAPAVRGGNYTPAPATAYVLLRILGPSGGAALASFAGQSFTQYGSYPLTLSPGAYALDARTASDARYTYEPSPSSLAVTLRASDAKEITVNYACATGAADLTVVPPEGMEAVPPGTVRLSPGDRDVSRGGLVPYLPPGSYTLNARDVQGGPYTYSPAYHPGQSLDVRTCETASATVAYRPVTGALRVVVNKAAGMAGSPTVRVSGPGLPSGKDITGTTTLENLVPGTYAVAPQDLLEDGVRFRGTASPANPAVEAGETATSTVSYAPVSAKLTVEVTGPSGAPAPSVRVTGPSGFSQSIGAYGSHPYGDLAPGTYGVQATTVSDSLYTYAPAPATASVSLAAGDRKTASVAYAPATGALRVTVQGLPAGASPSVVKVDGVPLSANPQTFPYQAPGNHTVQADTFTYGSYTYAPDAPSRTVLVSPGATATATVTYTQLQGVVDVTVSGLPPAAVGAGTAPFWTLTKPDGGTEQGRGSRTFSGMPTGTYRLTAADVTYGGITYRPTVSPASATLGNNGRIAFTVSYQAVTGALAVNISGLPSGVSASVVVTGPGGFSRTLTGSATLQDLTPGTYTLTPNSVTSLESTPYGTLTFVYQGTASPATVSVSAGATATASVAYAKQAGTVTVSIGNPAPKAGTASLTGPGGFSRSLSVNASTTSAYTFSGVPVGTYTLTPSDIYSTYLYKAAPASGNLTSGGTLSLSASYQPADGALSVTVSLPTGLPSPTVLLYQNGAEVGRFTGTSHTFTGLLPGTYEVRPQDIASGGYVYKAAPATVSVQAGKTASASLLYVKQSAYLSLTLKNVPSGATPTVRLTGSATYTYSASGTYELPLGSYSASADPLTAEGYTYTPVLSATSLNLSTPGSVYSLDVSYVENSAGISLAVSGLPSGVSATLSLSGPVSRSLNCGNGTCTFDRLLLGTYTLSAPDVRYGNYTYRATASPTSYTLSQAGQTATGTVSYQAVTGALAVTITTPAGMPAFSVEVRNSAGNLVATLTSAGTHALANLAPGTYQVVPKEATDADGIRYTAAGTSVAVTAGATATATVSYVKQAGTLSVSVSGLPSGCYATLTLTGAASRSLTLVLGRQSFTLPAGSYSASVGAGTCADGRVYRPSPASFSFALSTGGTSTQDISFNLSKGGLTLRVSGLPAGATVSLSVSGPGYSNTVALGNGSQTLADVPAGSYTVTAPAYTVNACRRYDPSPATATANVPDGGTGSASFAYGLVSTCSLTVTVSRVYPNTAEWPTKAPPALWLQENGANWRDISNPGTYTYDGTQLTPGAVYNTSPASGYITQIGANCFIGCWERRYWLLETTGFPHTAGSGSATATATWRAYKCYQSGLAWVCDVWDGSRWVRR